MGKYDDIINMPRHVSTKHPHMQAYDRAAQFSPFAALTGHDAAVQEEARLTERRIELDENEKTLLDEKLQSLLNSAEPVAEITYFQQDLFKSGGTYAVKKGRLRKLDMYRRTIMMEDMTEIKIDDIISIEKLKNL